MLRGILLAVACVCAGPALAHGPTIKVSDQEMKPGLLNLFVGTTVHFAKIGATPALHVVVDEAAGIESPALENAGDGWHYTFDAEGTYEIFIREHPGAKARIVVVPKRPRTSAPTPGP